MIELRAQVVLHQRDDLLPGLLRDLEATRVDRGPSGRSGQLHAERLGHARHGRGGAHRHAVPVRARHASLGDVALVDGHPAGLHLGLELPHVRSRTDVLALVLAVEHRPASDHDGRQIDAGRRHQQARRRLVAAGQQHHPVERVGAHQLLGLEREKVPVEHGGRAHQRLAGGHDGELQREPAGLPDATLDRLGDPVQVGVARRQLRPGGRDADHRPAVEHLRAETLVAHPRPVHHARAALGAEPLLAAPRSSVPAHSTILSGRRRLSAIRRRPRPINWRNGPRLLAARRVAQRWGSGSSGR